MGLDITMAAIGEFGKYQRRVFILLCLVGVPFSIFHTGPIFWAFMPQYQCDLAEQWIGDNPAENFITHFGNETSTNQGQNDMNKRPGGEMVFEETNDDKCYVHSFTDEVYGSLKGAYCADYTFKDSQRTSIVSRVSKLK